jgi:hypothetical protein
VATEVQDGGNQCGVVGSSRYAIDVGVVNPGKVLEDVDVGAALLLIRIGANSVRSAVTEKQNFVGGVPVRQSCGIDGLREGRSVKKGGSCCQEEKWKKVRWPEHWLSPCAAIVSLVESIVLGNRAWQSTVAWWLERKILIPKGMSCRIRRQRRLYLAAFCGIQQPAVHPFLGALMPDSTSAALRGKSIPRASLHTVEADGVRVFYREAGRADAPVLLLLHGYPASSHMFRELIPRMATSFA